MDSNNNSSCIQEASSTDVEKPILPTAIDRMGSGTSAVVDPADAGVEAESRKLPSSQYKGVVPQPNGRWGAQIYEKHQRVWLGTFNGESEAAKAYDVAAQRFRGRDAVTNFKPLGDTNDDDDVAELAFLNSHSKAEIVDMLRKHTYHDELCQSKRTFSVTSIGSGSENKSKSNILGGNFDSIEHLFDKTVTPSDVGKLNRLVIPKQHAEKHFPLRVDGDGCKGLLLTFEDSARKVWRFRYSYWNSSQSYVLTKGWSRFVKEKSLTAGDVVSFRQSKGEERQLYIDCKPRDRAIQQVVRLRLFGVNIFDVPREVDGDAKKRKMQHNAEELMQSTKMFKKQRVCSF